VKGWKKLIRLFGTYLVKAEPFDLPRPGEGLQELVQRLRGIPELCQVFSQYNDDFRALLSSISDELQLVQSLGTFRIKAAKIHIA
jgi:hypothetical protein